MRPGLALLALVAAACVFASSARADGDPASDFLLQTPVFFPFDAKIPRAKQQEALKTVTAANREGYKIRVAVIWSAYDLGAVTSLWRKPRTYAPFLGAELRFVYTGRLLIVMPNGFGFYWKGHPVDREYATLAKIPTGTSGVDLVDAAQKAVVALAAANGVEVDAKLGTTRSRTRQRAIIAVAAIGIVALAVLLRLALRKRA